ncbi:MAG: Ig-like domain-containing protein, partial [Clostridiales bacterium]
MEAQEFEQTLNAYFRLRQAEIAALTAPSWFEHELRRSAFLAERAEASLCDPLALAELTDMSGGLLAEETPASVSAQSVASQAPIVRRIAPFFGRQRKERPKKADTGRRWAWIGSFAVAAVVFMMVYAALAEIDDLPDSFSGTVTIAAVADNGAGISMEQGFVITAEQPLTEDLVRQSLSIAPATDYQLRAEDQGKTMIITPDAPLVGGTIYQLTFDPERYLDDLPERAAYTWAFQTEEPFAVLQTLPADMSTWVPVETAITVDFNQEVDVESAAKAIVIKPEIAGSWQGEGKHLTFMADQSLAYDTVYEVYLGEELHSAADIPLGEATMLRFETISQQGAEQQGAASDLTISNDESNFSPAAIPWITFYDATRSASVAEMQVKVYGFKDAQAYAAALAARSSEYFWTDNAGVIQLDSKDLPLVEEFSALPQSVTNHSFCYQIKFPQPLPAGYYLAKLVAGSQNYQMLFSVSTLSAYIAQGEQDVLFWLNCGQQAADEAVITAYYGSKQVKTDQNGIAV